MPLVSPTEPDSVRTTAADDCARGRRAARGEKRSNGAHTRAPHRVPRRSIWPEYRPRSSTAAKRKSVYGHSVSGGIREWARERARAGYRAARDGLSYGDLMCGLTVACGRASEISQL